MNELIVASLDNYYHTLALQHYQKYCIANDEYNKVSSNNQDYDFLLHSDDDNNKYIASWDEKQKNGIISIVFEAMAIEAYINYFIVKKYGIEVFNKEYNAKYKEKSIWFKYKDMVKKCTGKEFEEYNEEFELFSTLINIRNNMVHSKPEVVNFYADPQDFLNQMSRVFGGINDNIFNSIDRLINTFDVVRKILM